MVVRSILAKHHLLKHLFQGDPSLALFNHLCVHAIVVVVVFPAFLFLLKVELWLFNLLGFHWLLLGRFSILHLLLLLFRSPFFLLRLFLFRLDWLSL